MANTLQPNNIFNGTDGAVWITTDDQVLKIGSMKTFTLKQKNMFSDIDESESFTKKRKLVGVELSGELTKWKIDNTFVKIFEQYKTEMNRIFQSLVKHIITTHKKCSE